ncbi:MAG TPA: ABC transporter substrate-binding protein [Candidatus Limnocylindria bacterium]|nr:ABC transporter substrate-binding protein [Candidatus Limnocylindria bacterium]
MIVLAGVVIVIAASCAPPPPARVSFTWAIGRAEPRFDPGGPPDPVRWAIERLLGRGLLEEDTSGAIVPAAAARHEVTPDGLVHTFHLRPGLRFGDGTRCGSGDFRRAIESNLNRLDHATQLWLLESLAGTDDVRAGQPLPPLGIATPDDSTLVLRLARPDSLLPRKLALPGVAVPWSAADAGGGWRSGLGDYQAVAASSGRMTLVRRDDAATAGPDTMHLRFARGITRARAWLRAGQVDLLWPVPPGLLAQGLPAGVHARSRPARPSRGLLLVLRADLPPTSRPPARHALAHGLDRAGLLAALGPHGVALAAWLPGGEPFDFPRRDPETVRAWLERGKFRRSLHVVMTYSADGAGAEIARPMQAEWAGLGLDVELRPVSAAAFQAAARAPGGAQLALVESQSLLEDPVAELAALVTPARGPVIGGLRTGWRTREFDAWLHPRGATQPLDVAGAQRRLEQDQIVLPLARLPWLWVERTGGSGVPCHPHFGPDPRRAASLEPEDRKGR